MLFTVVYRAKLTLANKHGETALEVARNWGDEIVYAIVYAKAATLPALPVAKGIIPHTNKETFFISEKCIK